MRIIGGEFRGKKLISPKTKETRPLTDRVKESIFSTILVKDMVVCDLFCGCGTFGIEALSRGAKDVTFVDKSDVLETAKSNVRMLSLEDKVSFFKMDAFLFVKRFKKKKFDIVFCDPPYKMSPDKIVFELSRSDIVSPSGIVIVRTHKKREVEIPHNFSVVKTRILGEAKITFLRKEL